MTTSILSRKRDLAYLIHFSISVPMMFLVDLQALYPASIVPDFMKGIKAWYINAYQDDFFVHTPPFFAMFMWTELLYQLPVMIWGIRGLLRNSPKVPLVLLPFAILTFLTTLTCMVEYSAWPVPLSQKIDLTTLYGPYLALSAFMGIDMYIRLNDAISQASALSSRTRKTQ